MAGLIRILRILRLKVRALAAGLRREAYFRRSNIHVARGSFVDTRTVIGRGTRINAPSHLGECRIGKYCAIGGRLVVRSSDHLPAYLNMQEHFQRHVLGSKVRVSGRSKGPVLIGNGVWIGDSVIILPGVTIGDGAIIGAGSVVTKSVADYAIAVGNPAAVIRKRFSDEVISVLQAFPWWELDEDTLKRIRHLFELDLTTIGADALREEIAACGQLFSDNRDAQCRSS